MSKEGEWPSAIDLACETPYLAPQQINFGRIQSLIQARLRKWKDYAWAMREDPSFFVDVVGDWSEQSSTKILSETKKVHPDLTSALGKQNFWNRTIISAINEIHENLIMWDIVSKRIDIIMYMEDQDDKDDDDDDQFEDAVRELKLLLEKRVIEKMQRELGFILPSSPPMRSMFQRSEGRLSLRSELPKNDYLLFRAWSSGR
jgi:hypothetical protein